MWFHCRSSAYRAWRRELPLQLANPTRRCPLGDAQLGGRSNFGSGWMCEVKDGRDFRGEPGRFRDIEPRAQAKSILARTCKYLSLSLFSALVAVAAGCLFFFSYTFPPCRFLILLTNEFLS